MSLETDPDSIVISNWKWILDSSFCLLFLILNGLILISEIKTRRKSTNIIFVSKYIKMWPIVCMTCGLGVEICGLVGFLPFFCHFSRQLEFFFSGLQGVSMGFFQLSRLYYLFMSSTKGYSNIVFIVMYGIGVLILLSISTVSFLTQHINYCSFDNNLNYIEYGEYFYWFNGDNTTIIYMFVVCVFVYVLWDIVTLLLYVWKLMPFYYGTQNNNDNKILINSSKSILYKIIILTLMYQMTVIVVLNDVLIEIVAESDIIHIDSILIFIFLEGLLSTSMSYAILLMQHHNSNKYKQFLKVIHFVKCDMCICCCCKSVIRYELGLEQSQASELTNLTSVLEMHPLQTPVRRDLLLSYVDETTTNIICTIPTHSSKNQGISRGSNETKTIDDLSSATPMFKPTLQRDQVSELGNSKSSSDTLQGIPKIHNTVND